MTPNKIRSIARTAQSIEISTAWTSQITSSTLCHESLQLLVALVRDRRPTRILELGGGVSTAGLAGELDALPATTLLSCDHSSHYLGLSREQVGSHPRVRFLHAPLELYRFAGKRFVTYGGGFDEAIAAGGPYDMVLVDGPPGYEFGREAALYRVAPYLSDVAIILLDDSAREPEQQAMHQWKRVWADRFWAVHFPQYKKGFSVIVLRDASRIGRPRFGVVNRLRSYRATRLSMASPNLKGDPA